jgi:periplasmic divalent cation tolerance protein
MRHRENAPGGALLVFCSHPDAEGAATLAAALVEARLAACVQVLPGVTSVYRWQGRIERAGEVVLLIKTWSDRFEVLGAAIRARHPYELPEIMAVEAAAGLPAYLDWMRGETRGADPTDPSSE